MATTVARLQAVLSADTGAFDKGMDASDRKAKTFGSRLAGVGKAGALAAGAAGVGALVYTLKTGISEWTDSQKVAAQTEAVIKSTGGSANVTADEVSNLATAIMKKSGIDDEAVASGENLLLTFTNIRDEAGKGNDIFTKTTGIMADMAVALGKDPKTAALALGKALNDPVKGITALSRVGVSFTKKQKDLIKGMVESGDTMGAQKLILAELNKEFGGSAKAVGDTLPGQIKIAQESFKNFAGEIVGKMIPVLEDMVTWVRDHWPEISAAFQKAWELIKPDLELLYTALKLIVDFVVNNWATIGPIVDAVAKTVGPALDLMVKPAQLLKDILTGDWSKLWSDFISAIGDVKKIGEGLAAIGTSLGGAILAGLQASLTGIGKAAWEIIQHIGGYVDNKIDDIKAWGAKTARNIAAGILGGLAGLGKAAWDVINNIGTFLAGKVEDAVGWGRKIGDAVGDGIVAGIKWAIAAMVRAGEVGGGIAKDIANWVIRSLNNVIHKLNNLLEISFDTHIPGIGKVKIDPPDIPDIPTLAAGGIVRRPTLALIGESGPEAVIPLDRAAGQTLHVHYHGTVIQERDAAKTITAMLYRERSRGNPLLFRTS